MESENPLLKYYAQPAAATAETDSMEVSVDQLPKHKPTVENTAPEPSPPKDDNPLLKYYNTPETTKSEPTGTSGVEPVNFKNFKTNKDFLDNERKFQAELIGEERAAKLTPEKLWSGFITDMRKDTNTIAAAQNMAYAKGLDPLNKAPTDEQKLRLAKREQYKETVPWMWQEGGSGYIPAIVENAGWNILDPVNLAGGFAAKAATKAVGFAAPKIAKAIGLGVVAGTDALVGGANNLMQQEVQKDVHLRDSTDWGEAAKSAALSGVMSGAMSYPGVSSTVNKEIANSKIVPKGADVLSGEARIAPSDVPLSEKLSTLAKDWLGESSDDRIQKILDQEQGLKKVVRETGASEDLYKMGRLHKNIATLVDSAITKGVMQWDPSTRQYTQVAPPLMDAVKGISHDIDGAFAYAAAERALDKSRIQGKAVPFTDPQMDAMVQRGRAIPEYRDFAVKLEAFNDGVLDVIEKAGLISKDERTLIKDNNVFYTPFFSASEDSIMAGSHSGSGKPKKMFGSSDEAPEYIQNIIKQGGTVPEGYQVVQRKKAGKMVDVAIVKEGTPLLNNMLENLVKNTATLISAAEKNRTRVELFDHLDALPINVRQQYAVEAPDKLTSTSVSRDALNAKLRAAANKAGVPYTNLDQYMPDSLLTVLTRQPAGSKEGVEFVVRNGVTKAYKIIDPILENTLNEFGPKALEWNKGIIAAATAPREWLRKGVTSTPYYALKNMARDTVHVGVSSTANPIKTAPIVNLMYSAWKRFTPGGSDLYDEFLVHGGGMSSRRTSDPSYIKDTLSDLYSSHGIQPSAVLDTPARWADVFKRGFAQYEKALTGLENAPRFAEYAARRAAGEAPFDAGWAGRNVSTDFSQRGTSFILQQWDKFAPFTNSNVVGAHRVLQTLDPRNTKQFINTMTKGVAYITAPTVALWQYNRDIPIVQEQPDFVKDVSWIVPADEYGIPMFFRPDKDKNTASMVYYVPKPLEYGAIFGTLIEKLLDFSESKSADDIAKGVGSVLKNMIPTTPPVVLSAPLHIASNETFSGASIVPGALQNLPKAQQYTAKTSELAKDAGRATGQSPLVLEQSLKELFGGMATFGLNLADRAYTGITQKEQKTNKETMPGSRNFVNSDRGQTQDLQDFYKVTHAVNEQVKARSYNKNSANFDEYLSMVEDPQAMDLLGIKDLNGFTRFMKTMSELNKQKRVIDNQPNSSITADDKDKYRKQISEVQAAMVSGMMKTLRTRPYVTRLLAPPGANAIRDTTNQTRRLLNLN